MADIILIFSDWEGVAQWGKVLGVKRQWSGGSSKEAPQTMLYG